MTDLQPYNPQRAPAARGMPNLGNTCYYNSLMQALISIPGFPEIHHHQLMSYLRRTPTSSNDNAIRQRYGWQQEDAHEGYVYITEMLPRHLQRQFELRQRSTIICTCGHHFEAEAVVSNSIFVTSQAEYDQLFGLCNVPDTDAYWSPILADYKCDKCGQVGTSVKYTKLTMVGEVIVVIMKKYNAKSLIKYAENVRVGKHKFTLIAQVDHYGTTAGGHYNATCRRNNGWYVLDDSSVMTSAGITPSQTAYMLVYHYTK